MQDNRRREIRRKADFFRKNCKAGQYGIIDLFEECKRQGYKLFRYPLESADLGFAEKRDEDIIIFTNSSSRLSREIFTLAHEIGHIVLHINEVGSFIDDYITMADKVQSEKEQEANYFAACLLLPEEEVRRFIDLEISGVEGNELSAIDIARIMSEFNVSFDMVLNRLNSLGIIDGGQKIRLDTEKTEQRVGRLLQSAGGKSRLNIPAKEIDIPYEYIDYVIYNYNHNAVPRETLEKVLACYQLSIEDVGDRLVEHTIERNEDNLEDMIGELKD